ncbi:RNI-like protein [Punctularia strigosozonata HHB-11173 SS5]|uniref:RNI-like protein n=1 Tax=Punctularia strigosozonata (strain HHB-11173) TaxID=741275 RepID=UPI00044167FA|nr:RNI-like protein [Punctularia strigosozonata HHB-11173 SS5]EIN14424.1 RNI-like protein [Punctularia strigosozonata HHB-11173 SS5]
MAGASSPVSIGKGKGRSEDPPVLPPLAFTPMEVGYGRIDWPSPSSASGPSPSSVGSGYLSTHHPVTSEEHPSSPGSPCQPSIPRHRRSLSDLSIHSARSLSALSLSKIRVKLGSSRKSGTTRMALFGRPKGYGSPSNLATSTPGSPEIVNPEGIPDDTFTIEVGHGGGCFSPCIGDLRVSPNIEGLITSVGESPYPPYRPSHEVAVLKGKTRSYSSPFPLSAAQSPLLSVPAAEVSVPVPVPVHNYFEEWLPRELQLYVLSTVVDLHEMERRRLEGGKTWSVRRAESPKYRYMGRDKGIRELVKFSRVSKYWQSLVFDGALWKNFDFHSFSKTTASALLRVAQMAGTFTTRVDLSGHAHLSPSTLQAVTDHFSLRPAHITGVAYTRLTHVKLFGCSSLTTRSLQNLLMHSPSLEHLCVKGIAAVTDFICDLLAVYCPALMSLDMSRCPNLSGAGIRRMSDSVIIRGERLRLRELRLSGINFVDDNVMEALGRAAPNLEVLDLSYARHLHNSAIAAFVKVSEDDDIDGQHSVLLTPREAGRDPTESAKYRRRVTALRHLNLSSCMWLTDVACSNLAHAVPRLEFLEIAGIGAELKEEGLIHLLKTTPLIRKLDLEDASAVTDNLIDALAPDAEGSSQKTGTTSPPRTGERLEHLIISYASAVTDEALLNLIRRCTKLRVLEADNTHISRSVMQEFVRLSRQRQTVDAKLVAVDCRHIAERDVKDLTPLTRPRMGWRGYDARKLGFLDERDDEGLDVGQDECDQQRVVLKTFYSWQTVDAVRAAREKKRKGKSRRNINNSDGSIDGDSTIGRDGTRTRWWSPGGRRNGTVSPTFLDLNDREGCIVM